MHAQVWGARKCELGVGSSGAIGARQGPSAAVRGILGSAQETQGRLSAGRRQRPLGRTLRGVGAERADTGAADAHAAGGVLQRLGYLREPDSAVARPGSHAAGSHAVRQTRAGHAFRQHRHERYHRQEIRVHIRAQRGLANSGAGGGGATWQSAVALAGADVPGLRLANVHGHQNGGRVRAAVSVHGRRQILPVPIALRPAGLPQLLPSAILSEPR